MSTGDIEVRIFIVLGWAYSTWLTFEAWFRPERLMDRMEKSIWGKVDPNARDYATGRQWWRSKAYFRAIITFIFIGWTIMAYLVFARVSLVFTGSS